MVKVSKSEVLGILLGHPESIQCHKLHFFFLDSKLDWINFFPLKILKVSKSACHLFNTIFVCSHIPIVGPQHYTKPKPIMLTWKMCFWNFCKRVKINYILRKQINILRRTFSQFSLTLLRNIVRETSLFDSFRAGNINLKN